MNINIARSNILSSRKNRLYHLQQILFCKFFERLGQMTIKQGYLNT